MTADDVPPARRWRERSFHVGGAEGIGVTMGCLRGPSSGASTRHPDRNMPPGGLVGLMGLVGPWQRTRHDDVAQPLPRLPLLGRGDQARGLASPPLQPRPARHRSARLEGRGKGQLRGARPHDPARQAAIPTRRSTAFPATKPVSTIRFLHQSQVGTLHRKREQSSLSIRHREIFKAGLRSVNRLHPGPPKCPLPTSSTGTRLRMSVTHPGSGLST